MEKPASRLSHQHASLKNIIYCSRFHPEKTVISWSYTMEICGTCGVIARSTKTECAICSSGYEDKKRKALQPQNGLLPVRIEGEFQCRSCGSKVPLNYFSTDGYLCFNCGIRQKFDWEEWEQIIEHGHNVGDLTGFERPSDWDFWRIFLEQHDEDILRMVRSIGVEKTILTKGNSFFGGIEFSVDASPGSPVCMTCTIPFDIHEDEKEFRLTCPNCHVEEKYEKLSNSPYEGLVGCICEKSRTDAPSVKPVNQSGQGAIALSCPNCGGALDVGQLDHRVVCSYCNTTSLVPMGLFQREKGRPVSKVSWWMLFRGHSEWGKATYKELESRREKERKKREDEEWFRATQEKARQEKQAMIKKLLIVASIAAVAAGLIAAIWFMSA